MLHSARRALTLVDVAAAIAVLVIGGSVLSVRPNVEQPAQGDALANARRSTRRLEDLTHVRGILQGMIVWAQNNNDQYPLPSALDKMNDTVPERGGAKNTSANIMSLLVYNGFLPVEILVSPVETNPNIAPWEGYEFDQPRAAANPKRALWDPAFSADFSAETKGGLSYAHLQGSGGRTDRWSNTFIATEAALSMRGPEITGVTTNPDQSVTPKFGRDTSSTFGMYDGDKASWSGNVAYNDNHVNFAAGALTPGKAVAFDPEGRLYKDAAEKEHVDLMFFDEPDDAASVNDFLGIFIKAGEKPADFKAIWD